MGQIGHQWMAWSIHYPSTPGGAVIFEQTSIPHHLSWVGGWGVFKTHHGGSVHLRQPPVDFSVLVCQNELSGWLAFTWPTTYLNVAALLPRLATSLSKNFLPRLSLHFSLSLTYASWFTTFSLDDGCVNCSPSLVSCRPCSQLPCFLTNGENVLLPDNMTYLMTKTLIRDIQ